MNNKNTPASDIMIVDDTPANLRLLENILVEQGYQVRAAINGKLALMGARNDPPELILLDINMPGMDGYQVCKELKANPKTSKIPIIFISALDQTESKVKAFELGGVDYVTKPFQVEEVLARVSTHLSLRRLQDEVERYNLKLEQHVMERTSELVRLNNAAQRFVPHGFLQFLHKQSIADVMLGDQIQGEMTVLFADIVGFTNLSDRMTPQENFNYINAYLKLVSPVVEQHHGFIDKYLGDGVMALFPESADDALQAALAMQHEVAQYATRLQEDGLPPLQIGIGLHTGELMLGIIGDDHRWQGTVIADTVNIAARLEELTRKYSVPIIASEETIKHIRNPTQYTTRCLEAVQVRGIHKPILIHEVFGCPS